MRSSSLATLGRHQLASLTATVVDFGTFTLLVELADFAPEPATPIGACLGAVTNFLLSRHLVFRGSEGAVRTQMLRYALVSGFSLLLNTLGVFLLYRLVHVPSLPARLMTAVVVSLGWNFPLHRKFVFPQSREDTTKPLSP